MKIIYWTLSLIFLINTIHSQVFAQISGSNRIEYQIGNLPEETPTNMSNIYNQLNLFYQQDNFLAGTKVEIYNVANHENSYMKFSQKFLRYKNENLQLQIHLLFKSRR